MREIVRWRREHQPGGANAGSVFRNPEDDHAARLIEEAGCKGLRLGSAAVSEKHANFIQADEGGLAIDVYSLINMVRERVLEETGVELVSENHFVGFGVSREPPRRHPRAHDPRDEVAERTIAPRRRVRRLTKWLVALGVVVTVIVFGLQWMLHRPYFRVQQVIVSGNLHESAAAILGRSGSPLIRPWSTLNESLVTAHRNLPWVASVP